MKIKGSLALLFFFMVSILMIGSSLAQEGQTPEEQKMMELMAKYGQPGEFHNYLEPMVGSWNLSTKWWKEPGGEAEESFATGEKKWILGGRFLQENVSGELNGAPFHGFSITGHDNYNGEYFNFWIDEWSTMFLIAQGSIDETGKIISMTGTFDDIFTDVKDKKFKLVIRIADNDTHFFEMYDYGSDGEEWKSFEVKYTRVE